MILANGRQRGYGEKGQRIALMVALTESKLKMYANNNPAYPGIERSLEFPHDDVGNDFDSLNFFQQRWKYWGTVDELMNPEYAINAFYNALERKVPDWRNMPEGEAAQAVQGSDYPDRYDKWWQAAQVIIGAFPEGS